MTIKLKDEYRVINTKEEEKKEEETPLAQMREELLDLRKALLEKEEELKKVVQRNSLPRIVGNPLEQAKEIIAYKEGETQCDSGHHRRATIAEFLHRLNVWADSEEDKASLVAVSLFIKNNTTFLNR